MKKQKLYWGYQVKNKDKKWYEFWKDNFVQKKRKIKVIKGELYVC